jgi:hypothetical protein
MIFLCLIFHHLQWLVKEIKSNSSLVPYKTVRNYKACVLLDCFPELLDLTFLHIIFAMHTIRWVLSIINKYTSWDLLTSFG